MFISLRFVAYKQAKILKNYSSTIIVYYLIKLLNFANTRSNFQQTTGKV
ncbi:MAG: hypothetical protein ISEC1_P1700 [Thiomicrorhabdus sp.]|nr:MAG: hypothetical protein ISEC1_P1700 [Thiomicrorhabdus sp.]